MSRKKRHERIPPRRQPKKRSVRAWAAIAVVLVVGAAFLYLTTQPTGQAGLEYTPQDVVYDQPIHAVHEMKHGPRIPFLSPDQPQPQIAVPENTHDFGRVKPTAVVTYTFPIFNTGDAPLTISRAYTTCGCTTADITARVIPPGKVALVTLTFDAGFHDTRGQDVRRGLIIENNDRRQSKAEVWTRASVSSN